MRPMGLSESIGSGTEVERVRAERLLRWWKLKTQNARSLSDDEPKALRMVDDAMIRGEDYDDDHEEELFRHLAGTEEG